MVLLLISHMALVRKGRVPFLEGLLCVKHCADLFHMLVIPLICTAALQRRTCEAQHIEHQKCTGDVKGTSQGHAAHGSQRDSDWVSLTGSSIAVSQP